MNKLIGVAIAAGALLAFAAPAAAEVTGCAARFASAPGERITFRERIHFDGPPSHSNFSLKPADRYSYYKGSLEGRRAVVASKGTIVDRWTPTKTGVEVKLLSIPVLLDNCSTIYLYVAQGSELPQDVYSESDLAAAKAVPRFITYKIANYGYGPVPARLVTENKNVSYPVKAGERLEVLGVDTREFGQFVGGAHVMLKVRNAKGEEGFMSSSREFWEAAPQ